MTAFRNITVTPDQPVDQWGVEGISAAIERGDLRDWRRIATAVRADPHGTVAADLDEAIDLADGSSAAVLLAHVLADARRGPAAIVARQMRHDVRRTGMSLRQFASLLGTSHSRLATYLSGAVQPSAALAVKAQQVGQTHRL